MTYGAITVPNGNSSATPQPEATSPQKLNRYVGYFVVLILVLFSSVPLLGRSGGALYGASLPSDPLPYSAEFPTSFTISGGSKPVQTIKRPSASSPPSLFKTGKSPLPTNRWYQNLLIGVSPKLTDANKAYTIPYVIDPLFTSLSSPSTSGMNVHWTNVAPSGDKIVQVNSDPWSGVGLGVTSDPSSSYIPSSMYTVSRTPSPLQLELEWDRKPNTFLSYVNSLVRKPTSNKTPLLTIPITRGAPYVTAKYDVGATPLITSPILPVTAPYHPFEYFVMVDGEQKLNCTSSSSTTTSASSSSAPATPHPPPSLTATSTLTMHFTSDFTWTVYLSQPTTFSCRVDTTPNAPPVSTPGVTPPPPAPMFEIYTPSPLASPTTIRLALTNNCTLGTNVQHCELAKARDQTHYTKLLADHASIIPGPNANVKYTFPTTTTDGTAPDVVLHFDWDATPMIPFTHEKPLPELLMYALPHHVDVMEENVGKSTNVLAGHCSPSLHGPACLVVGGNWAAREELTDVSYNALRPPTAKYIPQLTEAIAEDLKFRIDENYMKGAGDTYFSGKMIAKLSRTIVIAQELREIKHGANSTSSSQHNDLEDALMHAHLPNDVEMNAAIDHLRDAVTIWLNGSAEAPFVYDTAWGGMVNCGCNYNSETMSCDNKFPNCPALEDPGMNFGHGFYNDHHFHHGYLIYGAAVVAKFDAVWGRNYFDPVLALIRDIANPSPTDNFFPPYRHKDVYLGVSWASGIGLINGGPYPNGRNQESSSESIAAYEAMALYGQTMNLQWGQGASSATSDNANAATAASLRDMSRFLLATELRSSARYYHVRKTHKRIYPKEYTPAVVGMLWTMMAQFQTWFGPDAFLAYGIQLLPLTPVSEQRDNIKWAKELFPVFKESCESSQTCPDQGWSVLLRAVQAEIGDVDNAMSEVNQLPDSVFTSAGGNGHSRTNTIWYLATRPYVEIKLDDDDDNDDDDENSGDSHSTQTDPDVLEFCPDCIHAECTSALNKCPLLDAPYLCLKGPSTGGCSPLSWEVGEDALCTSCCKLHIGC